MFSERTTLRLQDIVENADRITDYIAGLNFDQFETDWKVIDATERCLARISEAVVQMGEEQAADAELGVAWAEMKSLGNRLRHEYRRVNKRVIYEAARNDVPILRHAAALALAR